MLRVSTETKRKIEAAATLKGQSLTTFILTAAENAAKRTTNMTATISQPTSGGHTGVPTFFRARCLEASRGGSSSYGDAGYHLCLNLGSQQPYDLTNEAWDECLDQLREFADEQDEAGIISWFEKLYPRCMSLVPTRRRSQFAAGVYQARETDRI
ncbi:MAG: DUF1778 domain-containing protein [Actinomycetota bacterium]